MSRKSIYWVSVGFLLVGSIVASLLFFTTSVMVWLLPLFGDTFPLLEKQQTAENVTWFDEYYTIEYIDPQTIAIGEPLYHQQNYSYLILGEEKAVLFDSGPGIRDIIPVVKSLTSLPVTVTASHLHYDHTGHMGHFDSTALIDIPDYRAQVDREGLFTPDESMHLGAMEKISPLRVKVDEWWKPTTTLDLGGRTLTVLNTPGHTEGSLMLYDAQRKFLFTGDYIYRGGLIALVPGSHMGDYLETSDRLLKLIDQKAVLLTAHASGELPWQSPRLAYGDLADLNTALKKIKAGEMTSSNFFPTLYPVNSRMKLLGNFSWNMEW